MTLPLLPFHHLLSNAPPPHRCATGRISLHRHPGLDPGSIAALSSWILDQFPDDEAGKLLLTTHFERLSSIQNE